MIQITADTRRAVVTNKELLTKGSAGIQVQFTLSEDWAGLAKVAVFRQGDDGESVDCVLDSSLTCVMPPEILTTNDEVVFCGVYGSNGQGTIIIPTIWASLGVVRPGTEPNTPATAEPTPEIWAQILNVAQSAEGTANDAYTMAANAQGYIVEKTVIDAVDNFVENTVPTAIQGIEQAGATQAQAVEDKGDEVLDSIPQDYSDLVDDVADLTRQLSDVKESVGYGEVQFTVTAGNPHRISKDQLYYPIKQGEKYTLYISTNPIIRKSVTINGYAPGSNTAVEVVSGMSNTYIEFVAPSDIERLGFFITAVTADTVFTITLQSGQSIINNDTTNIKDCLTNTVDYSSLYTDQLYIALDGDIGSVVDTTPIASNSRGYTILQCKRGDTFVLTATGGSRPRAWGFTDNDYRLLSVAAANVNASNVTLIAERDGYFIANHSTEHPYSLIANQLTKALPLYGAAADVEDGIITRAKLNTDLQEKTDAVPELQDEIERIHEADGINSPYFHGPYDLNESDFSSRYFGLQNDYTTEGFNIHIGYYAFIDVFDSLLTLDPGYITKRTLGIASGQTSGGRDYEMYEYVLTPKVKKSSLNTLKTPKVFIDASIHGTEKESSFGLFYFLKDLITNWDKNPSLEAIRSGVELHVIPVANPWGFGQGYYLNANFININRNFAHNGEWHQIIGTKDANGAAPFDQPESAIIRDWLLASENDILAYFSCHSNDDISKGYDQMNVNLSSGDRNDSYYNRLFRVFTKHITNNTLIWPNEYQNITPQGNTFCGAIEEQETETSTKGTASAWANTMRRIVAMTLEGFNGLTDTNDNIIVEAFSAQAHKMNSENIGNMVIQVLREFASKR